MAISARMSSTRQQVVRLPNFTGLGKRPDLTPDHHDDLQTGMIGGVGGIALRLPMICFRRRNPVSGNDDAEVAPVLSSALSSTDITLPFGCVRLPRFYRW